VLSRVFGRILARRGHQEVSFHAALGVDFQPILTMAYDFRMNFMPWILD
jgi:hypothetical protein